LIIFFYKRYFSFTFNIFRTKCCTFFIFSFPAFPSFPSCASSKGKDLSGRLRIISRPPGFDPRTLQPVVSRCTDYAVPALLAERLTEGYSCTSTHPWALGLYRDPFSKILEAEYKLPVTAVTNFKACSDFCLSKTAIVCPNYAQGMTSSQEQSPSSEPNSPQLVKKFRAFYGTPSFITAFTRARQLSLS
jgi:hypothetical protein